MKTLGIAASSSPFHIDIVFMPSSYICLSGQLGSGKSSICTLLQEKYGYTVFSTGAMHREIAKEKGMSTLDFNAEITADSVVDTMIDAAMRSFAAENRGTNVIFDSRMAWHFVPESFKVFLLVSPQEAARRVFHGRNLVEESYESEEKAIADLIKRRSLENMRFLKFYGVDCDDFHNYDLILDTTCLSVEQTSEKILLSLAEHQRNIRGHVRVPNRFSPNQFFPNRR